MGDPNASSSPSASDEVLPSILTKTDFIKKYQDIDLAIRKEDFNYLLEQVMRPGPANLSQDPLLSIVIAHGKSDLAIRLISKMPPESLEEANHEGDTALHVAAVKGDVKVAKELVEKNPKLLDARNKHMEIPLHKAALYGQAEVFWALVHEDRPVDVRREDGATMLHCAIMGNVPDLALEIARYDSTQITRRNEQAVTPLQLLVTIPEAFGSQLRLGFMESFIYHFIPLEETCQKSVQGDEEELTKPSTDDSFISSSKDEGRLFLSKQRKRFPPNYGTLFDILQLACIPLRWLRLLTFNIIKRLSPRFQHLQYQKHKHKQTMDLIEYLAKDPNYWDFIYKGRLPENKSTVWSPSFNEPVDANSGGTESNSESAKETSTDSNKKSAEGTSTDSNKKNTEGTRWDDSPLTLGAKMGLHEFVEKILSAYPQSAAYPDAEGRNVLQVAIKHGREKIVDIIDSMMSGNNPVLPSWLRSSIEKDTKNTILHLAAEKEIDEYKGFALQMQFQLQWFKRVKKLLPKDLDYSRNKNEKTAQELFTENHKDIVKRCKEQLMELGKTCPSLVAAVVFASSFSIPGDKDSQNNPIFLHKIAFKVFSHAYVLGLSFAATALVLFLSLLTSSYMEHDFRQALPAKYILANISFFFALIAYLVSFSCNIYLNIYGGRKAETGDIVPMVCELTIFPAVCFMLVLYRSSTFGLGTYFRRVLS